MDKINLVVDKLGLIIAATKEHKAFVLYLNNSLKKYGKYLSTTNLCDLEDI